MSEMDEVQKTPKKPPKRLQKALDRLRGEGDEPLFAFPAVPRRYQDERSVAMARIGALDEGKVNTWLVVTQEKLVFIRGGLLPLIRPKTSNRSYKIFRPWRFYSIRILIKSSSKN